MLYLRNSLTNQKEEFISLNKKQVRIYTCGPTVYDFAHIGNLRSYLLADILQRTLKFNGYNVLWAMNITDVDDKTIKKALAAAPDQKPKGALAALTEKYTQTFWADLEKLNIVRPDRTPTATGTIGAMRELIGSILAADYAYIKDGSVYFNVRKYARKFKYGQLTKIDLKKMKIGTRIDLDEYDKESAQDFALWKAAKPNEPFWELGLGGQKLPGHPGWHIECSAMSKKYLGVPFDIHTGGVDLKFPHHENEIAQSAIGYHAAKLANFFLHNEHILVNGQRMAKRFHNFFTLNDLIKKGYNPLSFRYLVLQNHYSSLLNFTWESLTAAQAALDKIYTLTRDLATAKTEEASKEYGVNQQEFQTFINDDLDTPRALALLREILGRSLEPETKKGLIFEFDRVLGLGLGQVKEINIPTAITRLAEQRQQAREQKNWSQADKLRKEIKRQGYLIEDTRDGFKIKNKEKLQ
ncbi:MAG: cysteine--tRNA ligase [Candidatus Portnoybacteria bacterium CG10_big_fil_rev_8_21_14_0_10_44_7]|uniref:Cysteine--tRNA ligase n=1 Tax=Candidatus Portnoybacteria bacterium CG10_big_fil_rev_8_21_14_0_10_44_7 TaxID=1974816 RepID=A0A2M8KIQ9_9BACT|nr:MAG: cysteine--tRNA ligase [Candidatus Portnoybacteria bacterium CG10_big_fil_rev_8_21_14_0_10_44_7]